MITLGLTCVFTNYLENSDQRIAVGGEAGMSFEADSEISAYKSK